MDNVHNKQPMHKKYPQSMTTSTAATSQCMPAVNQPTYQPIYQPVYQPPVGPCSTRMICHNCRSIIRSSVEHINSTKTHILALLLCVICCCCIPYYNHSCMDVNHTCPNCHTYLGKYSS